METCDTAQTKNNISLIEDSINNLYKSLDFGKEVVSGIKTVLGISDCIRPADEEKQMVPENKLKGINLRINDFNSDIEEFVRQLKDIQNNL